MSQAINTEAQTKPLVLRRGDLEASRLAMYALFGGLCGAVPLPWLPSQVLRRIRGALLHDAASRAGISLTPEARALLSEPLGPAGLSGSIVKLGGALGIRAIGGLAPLALLSPVLASVETLALGHLVERYFNDMRAEKAVRMDEREARMLRSAMNQALLSALRTKGSLGKGVESPDDLRDSVTQTVDTLVHAAVSIPAWLARRLDAAFEQEISKHKDSQ